MPTVCKNFCLPRGYLPDLFNCKSINNFIKGHALPFLMNTTARDYFFLSQRKSLNNVPLGL